jgi:steroid delta-isomerase-like uncharacterized protein
MKYHFALLFCCICLFSYGQEKSMSTEKQLALTYFDDVLNNKILDLLNTLFDPEFVFHGVDGKDHQVIKDSSIVRFLKYLFKAFPDLHYTVDVAVAQDTDVGVYVTATGTHRDEFHGFPASGNKISFKEAFFFRIRNSKITEGWGIVDLEGLKDQLKKE